VAIVNETLARKHWGTGDAVGRRVTLGTAGEGEEPDWITVVGVVGDVRHQGLDVQVEPMIYLPHAQSPSRGMMIVMRTVGDPLALTGVVRSAVWEMDPDIPLSDVRAMEVRIDESVAKPRFMVQVLTAFGAVALMLAAIGIYGVMSFAVVQQTRDIGIRIAFGAEPRTVLAMVLRRGLSLAVIGVALGLAVATGATRAMSTLLFGVGATDPLTFVSFPIVLVAVAALATYLPARRATRVDPITALRTE
jgi:predicted permease